MGLSVGGLGSGLDIDGMITKLMAIEAQPLTVLNNKEAKAQAKATAWNTVKSAVSAFQAATDTLKSASAFNQPKGSSTKTDVATVTPTAAAKVGSVTVEVSQLAKASKVMLLGTFTEGQIINSGPASNLNILFGNLSGAAGAGAVFTPDPSASMKAISIRANATLEQGVEDINNANAGVTARIVSTPAGKKVVMESTFTGANSDFKALTTGGILNDGANAFGYSPDVGAAVGSDLVSGEDAQYKIDDVPITSKNNTITDALLGSTISLNGLSATGVKTTISVTRDSDGVKSQVDAFVKAYNELNTTLRSLSAYGVSPGKGQAPTGGGVLSGDSTIRTIQTEIRSMFNQSIPGAPKGLSSMVDVGVLFKKDGSLEVDSATLDKALSSNAEGVRQLFMGRTTFSASGFTALSSNSLTKTGSYGIEITNTPSQAKLAGSQIGGTAVEPPAFGSYSSARLTPGNLGLKLNVDGTIINATLTSSIYNSAAEMATGIQAAINLHLPSTRQVTVAHNASTNQFEITSGKKGSISKVEVLAGTTLSSDFGLVAGSSATGTSLAGKVGGVDAWADDDSMTLIAATGSGATGLKFKVDDATLGSRGVVSFASGFAYNLGNKLSTVLATSKGLIDIRTSGLEADIKRIDDQRTRVNNSLVRKEAAMRKQFNAMDSTVSKYNQLSTYLTQQLKALVGSSSSS